MILNSVFAPVPVIVSTVPPGFGSGGCVAAVVLLTGMLDVFDMPFFTAPILESAFLLVLLLLLSGVHCLLLPASPPGAFVRVLRFQSLH